MPLQKIDSIPVFGEPSDEGTLKQIRNCAREAAHVALMADNHRGYAVPIGGVVAYEDRISPSGIGFDIACGNKAVLTDADAAEVRARIGPIMDDIWKSLSFGIGLNNAERVDHELFDDPAWKIAPMKSHKQMAQNQLGTIGSGNHYVDIFEDERERIWVGVHFGSRGLGHKTATHFLKAGGAKDGMDVDPLVLDVSSPLGADYLECMRLAGRYAYAGRDWVCARVVRILGAAILEEVHNHHNFCLPASAKVPTPNGPRRMDELKEGDRAYAFDPTHGLAETPVLDVWRSGRKPIHTIRTMSREIRCSGDHPVQVVERVPTGSTYRRRFNGRLIWKKASEIRPRDLLVCADGYYGKSEASIGVEIARLVGAFLGDGWVRHSGVERSGHSVGLAIGGNAEPHTSRYADLCRAVFPRANWHENAKGAFGLTCSSRDVRATLESWGVVAKAPDKCVPSYLFAASREEKLAFMSGYFDSDGSVSGNSKNRGRGTVASVSRDLVEGVREVAIGCGMRVTPVRRDHRITNYGECDVYQFVIAAAGMARLDLWHEKKRANLCLSVPNVRGLSRATIGYLDLPEGIFVQYVTDVSVGTEEEVFDLTVAHPSHSFVCEGVVVHNCWRETHGGRDYWVVRKGATPAFPGQKGFVGGSMGDISVILEGVESPEAAESLYSTVHGAGRVMSRTAARGKINYRTKEVIAPGAVSREMMMEWVRGQGVELRGAGTDESPHCYKRLPEVLAHHAGTIRILHTLKPLGVAMAGENEVDPYKD